QQAYRAMPSARLSALSQQLANRMLIRWRTRQEQTFRMSGRITFRMPVPKKVRRPVTDWDETLNSGWGGRTRTSEWQNQQSPLYLDFAAHSSRPRRKAHVEHQRVTTRFPTIEPADGLSRKIGAGEGNRTLVISLEGPKRLHDIKANSDISVRFGPLR